MEPNTIYKRITSIGLPITLHRKEPTLQLVCNFFFSLNTIFLHASLPNKCYLQQHFLSYIEMAYKKAPGTSTNLEHYPNMSCV